MSLMLVVLSKLWKDLGERELNGRSLWLALEIHELVANFMPSKNAVQKFREQRV
jgi:hypothetical protein